jgi:hypothetical protein
LAYRQRQTAQAVLNTIGIAMIGLFLLKRLL